MNNTNQDLDNIRHSLAHVLAASVLKLYPEAKHAIGPAVDNGFYFDFDFGKTKIGEEDLKKIEKQMKKTLSAWKGTNVTFEREEMSTEDALEFYKDNEYKRELIEEITKKGEVITFYRSGDYIDLCRGGHVDTIEALQTDAFKLDRVAGAYFRSDESRPMLTRIYGLGFANKEDLVAYQNKIKLAKERDHRKIGAELDLFTFSPLVGGGLPLFTPKGTLLRDLIVDKIHNLQADFGYSRVSIPHITKPDLYKTSGHWEKFGDELFKVTGKGDELFVMKPMNCPHHTQIFASTPRSYRDLPVRYVEATTVYRDEQSGELLGLSRVRSITQDDGHVFCTHNQMKDEIKNIISVIRNFYQSLDLWKEGDFWVSHSIRDPETPEKYLGDTANWDLAEKTLLDIAREENLPVTSVPGEAAFYGPKLDFMFKDSLGREWQLATAQLDFIMPERFKLEYTDNEGNKQTPVMIHRAIAGSLERFLSVIIEHFNGYFPFWLAPVQVSLIPVSTAQEEFAVNLSKTLESVGVRVDTLIDNNPLGKRLRRAKTQKVPFYVVIGEKEMESNTISLESTETGEKTEIKLDKLVDFLQSLT